MTSIFSRARDFSRMSKSRVATFLFLLACFQTPDRSSAAPGDLLLTIANPTPGAAERFGGITVSVGDAFVVAANGDSVGGIAAAGAVHEFDAATGSPIRTIANPNPLEFTRFGAYLTAVGDDFAVGTHGNARIDTIYHFDGANGTLLHTINESDNLHFLHPLRGLDNEILVHTFGPSEVAVFDSASGAFKFVLTPPVEDPAIGSTVVATQNAIFASGSAGVYEFDRASGGYVDSIPLVDAISSSPKLMLNESGDLVIANHNDTVYIFDIETLTELKHFEVPGLRDSVFELIGNTLAVTDFQKDLVKLYDASTGEYLLTLTNPSGIAGEFFGISISLVGNNILVGAPGADLGGPDGVDAGAVYLFEGFTEPSQPGDTNSDGVVDLDDLNNVRNNFGGIGIGDTNTDGVVDLDDMNSVRNHFGETTPSAAVPEPGGLVLGTIAMCLCAGWRVRPRRNA